jgi:prepilin-type N-terminal cleavage/methylation domain-containing protein
VQQTTGARQLNQAAGDPPGSSGGESGFTLVEMLIAVFIMGLIATAVLGALGTVVRASRSSNELARVEAVMSAAADRLEVTPYIPCATTSSYAPPVKSASGTVEWGPSTVSVLSVTYWNGTAFVAGPCSTTSTLNAIQRITFEVVSPDGVARRQMEVVKTDVAPQYR